MKDQEAQDVLKRVIAIIEAEKVPDDLRPAAFDRIWSAITGTSAAAAPAGAEVAEPPSRQEKADRVAAFAARLDQKREAVEDVFEPEEDGSFRVQVATSKLENAQKPGTEQLALLVCAGRQAAEEDKTSAEAIREVCDQYGKYNSPNFAKTLRGLDKLLIISGTGKQMTLKMRKTGWEEAGKLVGTLASV